MKEFFKELFEYSHHFNQEMADVFNKNLHKTRDLEKSIKLFSHILNAHQIWNNRVDPKQTNFGVWEIHLPQNLKKIDQLNFENSLVILDKFDLNNTINYSNTKGQPFSNSIQVMLFHVINHSTYHRGQIATDFKLHGLDPLVTDFIAYKR